MEELSGSPSISGWPRSSPAIDGRKKQKIVKMQQKNDRAKRNRRKGQQRVNASIPDDSSPLGALNVEF